MCSLRMTYCYTWNMRIRIYPHALEHGLTGRQIVAAYETGAHGAVVRSWDTHIELRRWALIGFDDQGRQIELVFIRLVGDEILVFHARYLTKGFLAEVRKAHEQLR